MNAPAALSDGVVHDELVVELDYCTLVIKRLDDLGVTVTAAPEEDLLLGLARLPGLRDTNGAITELDPVLDELRLRFRADFAGWVPPVGKSREAGGIVGMTAPWPAGGPVLRPTPDLVAILGHKPMSELLPEFIDHLPAPTAHPEAGRGVRIGMVDTALVSPAGGVEPATPAAGHGTFVASVIRATAPAVDLVVSDVLSGSTGRATLWETAQEMLRLTQPDAYGNRIHILNLSLGCFTRDGMPPLVVQRAIERLHPDVLVVAAAGNHGNTVDIQTGDNPRTRRSPMFPAALPGVVGVGARDGVGERPLWSPNLPWVCCTAPGDKIDGAYVSGFVHMLPDDPDKEFIGFARWSGTSFAAANVTGAIAAAMSTGGPAPGPGTTARAALKGLLAEQGGVVQPFTMEAEK